MPPGCKDQVLELLLAMALVLTASAGLGAPIFPTVPSISPSIPHVRITCRLRPCLISRPNLPQSSLLGYATCLVGANSSLMARMFTKRVKRLALPALSSVPLALEPPKGCWPTTAPVLLQLM